MILNNIERYGKKLDLDLALKCASLAEKCYFKLTYSYKDNGFLIEEENDIQYIAIPGSNEIRDWWADAKFVKVSRDGLGLIANGIADYYDEIIKEILKLLNKNKKIILTGHSLGGALATVISLHLKQNGYDIDSLYSFGSPRAGNKDFAEKFEKLQIPHFRFVNKCDIVPTIPDIGFDHTGKSIYMDDGKILKSQKSAFKWALWKITASRFLDHKSENYIKGVRDLIKNS